MPTLIVPKGFVYLLMFLVLATSKGLVELWAYRRQNRGGGMQAGRFYSVYSIVLGALTPVLILAEIVLLESVVPPVLSLVLAAVYLGLLAVRVVAIRTLGPYYSVNIRIVEDHQLVTSGIYRYVRNPIYVVGLLENLVYPLACGAWATAALLVLLGTPPLLARRAEEERLLAGTFGDEYAAYRARTWG